MTVSGGVFWKPFQFSCTSGRFPCLLTRGQSISDVGSQGFQSTGIVTLVAGDDVRMLEIGML
jgi:hypothetical protein